MRLLRESSAVIEHNGGRFNLLGVDYQRDHMTSGERTGPMLEEISHLVRRDMPNILLSHNPNSFPQAAAMGIELSLAGHTHGGQVKVEIVDHNITPARLISPFVAGLYRVPMNQPSALSLQPSEKAQGVGGVDTHPNVAKDATLGSGAVGTNAAHGTSKAALYVNRGLGTFGFPVRLGVPPEITVLTLRRA
jgi:predicted MPP superfamily phosphohydrolase